MLMQCQKSSETSLMCDLKRQMWVLSGPWALSPRPEAPPGGSQPWGWEDWSPSPCFTQKSTEAQGCGRCLRSSGICGRSETRSWFLPCEKTPGHGRVATHRSVWTAGGRPAPSHWAACTMAVTSEAWAYTGKASAGDGGVGGGGRGESGVKVVHTPGLQIKDINVHSGERQTCPRTWGWWWCHDWLTLGLKAHDVEARPCPRGSCSRNTATGASVQTGGCGPRLGAGRVTSMVWT